MGIVIVVAFLIAVLVMGFPTRRRAERAYIPAQGPHPFARPFLALARRRRQRQQRRRRRRLRVV